MRRRSLETIAHTLRLDAKAPDDRRAAFTLPNEVPVGEAEFVLVVVSKAESRRGEDDELMARMRQQEAEGKLTIPPEFGEYRPRSAVRTTTGGFVGAVEALIEERDERR